MQRRSAAPLLLLLLLIVVQLAAGLEKGAAFIEDADRFPGWRGELPSHLAAQAAQGDTVGFGELGQVRAAATEGAVTVGRSASICPDALQVALL